MRQVDYLARFIRLAPLSLAMARAADAEALATVELQEPLLDLGCGQGWFAHVFLAGRPAIGLDLNAQELLSAQRHGYGGPHVAASAEAIPFRHASFATVLANSVLQHIPDLDAALREIARVLRPGGRLVITVPSDAFGDQLLVTAGLRALGLRRAANRYVGFIDRYFVHRNRFGLDQWRQRMQAAGLSIARGEPYFPPSAQHLYELLLPVSVPSKICRRVLGRWVVGPRGWVDVLFGGLVRRRLRQQADRGSYLLIVAEKPGA